MAVLQSDGKVGTAEKKEVTAWLTRIKIAENFRESENRKTAWTNAKKYYQNKFKDETISVNMIYALGRQMVPFLYFKNPQVEISALRQDFIKKAKILEAVDNMLIRAMRMKEQLKLIIQDTFLYDYGIRKVGYDSEFGFDETKSLFREIFQELGVELTDEELKEYNTYVTQEFPFFLRVPPRRFGVDPDVEGPSLDTARWVFEEFYRPLADVLEDDRYDCPKNLKATYMLNKTNAGNVVISPKKEGYAQDDIYRKSDSERVRLWEVWDKKTRERMVIADGHYGFLLRTEDVWELPNFFPYDRLCFNPISDEHYSVSDAMYVEKQQIELNDAVTQQMYHRRKENTKFFAKKDVLSPEAKASFEKGKPLILIEVETAGAIGEALQPITSSMSPDIERARADIRNDFQEILSMGKNQLSQEMGKRKTASEAMIINQYTELRSDERRDIVADFIVRAIEDINILVFKFWDVPDVIEVVGDEGRVWEEWSGESLAGKYGIDIVPNSTIPQTRQMYQQKIAQVYQSLQGNPVVNLKEATRLYLDSFDEFDTEKLLLVQPGEPTMADYRPGKRRHQDSPEGQPPGSRMQTPDNPEMAMAAGENAGIQGAEKGGNP
jgi:hypothetical protein